MQYILTASRYANLVENHLFTLMKVSLILPLNLAKQKMKFCQDLCQKGNISTH